MLGKRLIAGIRLRRIEHHSSMPRLGSLMKRIDTAGTTDIHRRRRSDLALQHYALVQPVSFKPKCQNTYNALRKQHAELTWAAKLIPSRSVLRCIGATAARSHTAMSGMARGSSTYVANRKIASTPQLALVSAYTLLPLGCCRSTDVQNSHSGRSAVGN